MEQGQELIASGYGQPRNEPISRQTGLNRADGVPSPVCVVLSTYNGSEFLCEQLASLLAQSHSNWTILWRDDGSIDTSADIMRAFAGGEGAGRVVDANDSVGHLGIANSFMALVRRAPPGQILAFADQDDVWLAEKLARGVNALQHSDPDRPALYCARQVLVDAGLRPLSRKAPELSNIGFPQSLTKNIATGCTIMLNPAAVRLLAAMHAPATLHDWWAYIVVTAVGGSVISDPEATVLYRQHPGNAVGVRLSFGRRALAAVRRGPGEFMRTLRAHVAALDEQHDLLDATAQGVLAIVSAALNGGWTQRSRALLLPGFRRPFFFENLLFRIWFLFSYGRIGE